jgi:hypothetical protein
VRFCVFSQTDFPFVFVHRLIAFLDVESDEASDFDERQNSSSHEVRNRSYIAAKMLCHLALITPRAGRSPWFIVNLFVHEIPFDGVFEVRTPRWIGISNKSNGTNEAGRSRSLAPGLTSIPIVYP